MTQATVYVPRDGICFIVEDDPIRRDWFLSRLGAARVYGLFDDPKFAIEHLHYLNESVLTPIKLKDIAAFFLDHDLGGAYRPPFSIDIAQCMQSLEPGIGKRTIIHSLNEPGARNLQAILPGSAYFPFGSFTIEDKD